MFENMFQHLVFFFIGVEFSEKVVYSKMSLSIVLIHRNSIVCTRHKSDDRMTIRGALYKVTCDAGRPQKLQRRAERCEIVNKFVEIDTNK